MNTWTTSNFGADQDHLVAGGHTFTDDASFTSKSLLSWLVIKAAHDCVCRGADESAKTRQTHITNSSPSPTADAESETPSCPALALLLRNWARFLGFA